MAKHKPDVRLAISTRRNTYDRKYSVELHVAVVQKDGVKNPGYFYLDDPDYPTNAYNDLCVRALYDEDLGWFGWSVAYREPIEVDVERAATMLKILRKVKASMERAEREFGHPESFPAFAMRAVRALGATTDRPFGVHDPARSVDGTKYRWFSPDGLRSFLADTVTGKVPPTYRG